MTSKQLGQKWEHSTKSKSYVIIRVREGGVGNRGMSGWKMADPTPTPLVKKFNIKVYEIHNFRPPIPSPDILFIPYPWLELCSQG